MTEKYIWVLSHRQMMVKWIILSKSMRASPLEDLSFVNGTTSFHLLPSFLLLILWAQTPLSRHSLSKQHKQQTNILSTVCLSTKSLSATLHYLETTTRLASKVKLKTNHVFIGVLSWRSTISSHGAPSLLLPELTGRTGCPRSSSIYWRARKVLLSNSDPSDPSSWCWRRAGHLSIIDCTRFCKDMSSKHF